MTLTDAITRVRAILKETTESFFKDSEITTWLNEGNKDFHSWKGIQDIWTTSVDGETEIGLDTSMVRLHKLTFIAYGETEENLINSDTYDIFKDRIIFDQKLKHGTLTWYGERLPVIVSVGTTAFEIDPAFESALVEYATFKGFEKDEDNRMSVALASYQTLKMMWERKHFDKYNGEKTILRKKF